MPGKKRHQTIDSQVLARIRRHGRGWVFTPGDFDDLGGAGAVRVALMRACRKGVIRRLAHGLYDYPRVSKLIGPISPSPEDVAKALAARDGSRVQPTGAYAANLLGLSQQLPMKVAFLTDGRSCRKRVGGRDIILKHRGPREMATAGRMAGTLIQALKHLGREHMDAGVLHKLRKRIPEGDRPALLKDARLAPEWIARIMRDLAKDE